MKTITEDEFWDTYKPQLNTFYNDEDGCSFGGCMYETYGAEEEYVENMVGNLENHVWTIVDDGEDMQIISGHHWVNRFGYLITEIPWEEDIEVTLDTE